MPREYHQSTGDDYQPRTERDRRYTHVDASVLLGLFRGCHCNSLSGSVLHDECDACHVRDWH